jgi:hypothetical protein
MGNNSRHKVPFGSLLKFVCVPCSPISAEREALKLKGSSVNSFAHRKPGRARQMQHAGGQGRAAGEQTAIAKYRRPGVRGKGGRESPVCCGAPAARWLVRTRPSAIAHHPSISSKPPRIPPPSRAGAEGRQRLRAQRRAPPRQRQGPGPGPQHRLPIAAVAPAAGDGAGSRLQRESTKGMSDRGRGAKIDG